MHFPVAPAVMNDGSWCFKALLHLAVHLVSTVRFSLEPSVFLLWLTGSKNSKHGGSLIRWRFHGVFWLTHPYRKSLFNVSNHCFISHSIFYIYNVHVRMCSSLHARVDAWPCLLARVICHTLCWYAAVSWLLYSYNMNRSVLCRLHVFSGI